MTKNTVKLIIDVKHGFPKFDAQNRQHCEDGPSFRIVPENWDGIQELNIPDEGNENGCQVYLWHGLVIDPPLARVIIEHPETITIEFIDKLNNIEIRRIAIERFGIDNYIKAGGFEVLHSEYVSRIKNPNGEVVKIQQQLVRKSLKNDEPLTGVFAPNSSPNGTYENVKETFIPITEFESHEQNRILRKYENTGSIKTINNVLCLKQTKESGKFTPDLDQDGNYIYKMYFMPCHFEIRPLILTDVKDMEGDPVMELGDPQEPTCHNALASTFGLYGDEYIPDVET